jgi:tRNA-splicing ligase RtcB (3'-phosphate/5'-hydroxy nucleic acid ligase)
MSKLKLKGKEIRAIGYPEGPVISIAMNTMERHYKHADKEDAMDTLKEILASPADYVHDTILGLIAKQLLPKQDNKGAAISLNHSGIAFNIFGSEQIEQGAINQMQQAAKLPIALAGALMPDAHPGYGLPIGGVLATENAVIPYGVGVDIGCRMCLSIFDIDPAALVQREQFFARELNEATLFGGGRQFDQTAAHEVIDRAVYNEIPLLKGLQSKAAKQLGSSGSGNHFVEFGTVEIMEKDEVLGMAPGKYLGLLSHSGSRALGASIANYYTRIAKEKRRLPGEAANLAWLTLDEEEGIEYWMAMNLAGDYAAACHEVIHEKIATLLGRQAARRVENHHNFAWKENWEGRETIVHRKGATPAGKDVLGIIPGSMTAPGYIVKGKGEPAALSSAAHGAGRKMSRTAAMNSITHELLKESLYRHGVTLLGGGLDEAPQAYKDIEEVMRSQKQLVDIVGKFIPKIVRMDGTKPRKTPLAER